MSRLNEKIEELKVTTNYCPLFYPLACSTCWRASKHLQVNCLYRNFYLQKKGGVKRWVVGGRECCWSLPPSAASLFFYMSCYHKFFLNWRTSWPWNKLPVSELHRYGAILTMFWGAITYHFYSCWKHWPCFLYRVSWKNWKLISLGPKRGSRH